MVDFEEHGDSEVEDDRKDCEMYFERYKTAVEAHLVREGRLGGHGKPSEMAVRLQTLETLRGIDRSLGVLAEAASSYVS